MRYEGNVKRMSEGCKNHISNVLKWSNVYEICFITMTSIQAYIHKYNNCHRNIFTSVSLKAKKVNCYVAYT